MSIVDVEFRRLQEELLQKKAEAEDLEASYVSVTAERNAALAEQERLQEELKSLRTENLELQMKLDTALQSKSDGSAVQLTTEQSARLRDDTSRSVNRASDTVAEDGTISNHIQEAVTRRSKWS